MIVRVMILEADDDHYESKEAMEQPSVAAG